MEKKYVKVEKRKSIYIKISQYPSYLRKADCDIIYHDNDIISTYFPLLMYTFLICFIFIIFIFCLWQYCIIGSLICKFLKVLNLLSY